MSVTASIGCLECGSGAPGVGDCGHVGYPSLEDSGGYGDFVSFEFIYRGYAALGLRLAILDQIRAWLIEHASHRVELRYEGEPIGRARRPVRRGQPPLTPYRPDIYERCFLEIRCIHCDTYARSAGSELMVPFDEEVTGVPLAKFEKRILEGEPESFYRTGGLLDPQSSEFDAIRAFLRRHGTHRLRARSVAGETWTAVEASPRTPPQTSPAHREAHCSPSGVMPRTSLGPPLKVAWVFNGVVNAPLLVEGGVVYTVTGNHDTMVALDRTGSEIWRTPGLGDLAVFDAVLAGDRIWLPASAKESQSYRHWSVDPRTGKKELAAEDAPSIETFVSPAEFIGTRWRPKEKLVESVGRFAVGPPLRTVWEMEVPSDVLRGTLGAVVACDGQRVFASWGATVLALEADSGRELWRSDLSPHGRHWGSGDYLQLSTSGGVVVYGLIGSLHGLSAETGAVVWSQAGQEMTAYRAHYGDTLCLAGRHVFGGSEVEHLCLVLAVPTGAERCRTDPNTPGWRAAPQPRPKFTTLPRPSEEVIYLGDMDGRLWALSSNTGDPVWMQGLKGARSAVNRLVIDDDRLLAMLFDGRLYCLVPA